MWQETAKPTMPMRHSEVKKCQRISGKKSQFGTPGIRELGILRHRHSPDKLNRSRAFWEIIMKSEKWTCFLLAYFWGVGSLSAQPRAAKIESIDSSFSTDSANVPLVINVSGILQDEQGNP